MPEPSTPGALVVTPVVSALRNSGAAGADAVATCERCGAEIHRMHAVWRCPAWRFKTDGCGW